MSLALLIAIALGLLAGAVAALRVIAPATKTDKDDKVLADLEKVQDVADKLPLNK